MTEKSEIVVAQKQETETEVTPYRRYQDNVDKDGNICVPLCKICNHEDRGEIEQYYERTLNYNGTYKWIKSRYPDFAISFPSVRNHMIYHYKSNKRQEGLEGYANDIKKWMAIGTDKIGSLKKRKAQLDREFTFLGSEADSLSPDERRKHITLMKSLADTLLAHDKELDALEKKIEPVIFIFRELNVIMTGVAKRSNAPEIKNAFDEVLEQLELKISDIVNME